MARDRRGSLARHGATRAQQRRLRLTEADLRRRRCDRASAPGDKRGARCPRPWARVHDGPRARTQRSSPCPAAGRVGRHRGPLTQGAVERLAPAEATVQTVGLARGSLPDKAGNCPRATRRQVAHVRTARRGPLPASPTLGALVGALGASCDRVPTVFRGVHRDPLREGYDVSSARSMMRPREAEDGIRRLGQGRHGRSFRRRGLTCGSDRDQLRRRSGARMDHDRWHRQPSAFPSASPPAVAGRQTSFR